MQKENEGGKKMSETNKKLNRTIIIIMVLMTVAMLIWLTTSSKNNTEEEREIQMRYATQLVDNAINKAFIRPITAAKVMSEDANLKEYFRKSATNPKSVESQVSDYLTAIGNGLGYKMMFAVSDASGAYFTTDGITSYIDKSYLGNSSWYGALMESGKELNLDVDIEESTNWELSVFVNQLVYDDNKLLGVCGVGVEMSQLQSLFELYERIYDVKINVTDKNGLIQIDTVVDRIEKDSISLPELDKISDGEYYYEKLSDGDRVITYMEDLDMYLVVTNQGTNATNILSDILVPMLIALIGIGTSIIFILCTERMNRENTQFNK